MAEGGRRNQRDYTLAFKLTLSTKSKRRDELQGGLPHQHGSLEPRGLV
jgi:hypothetical protein